MKYYGFDTLKVRSGYNGITADTIRLSIGLEDAADSLADLDRAFTKAFPAK